MQSLSKYEAIESANFTNHVVYKIRRDQIVSALDFNGTIRLLRIFPVSALEHN